MANSKQACKRARQAEVRRQHNSAQRSAVRTSIKNVLKTVKTGDHAASMAAFNVAQKVLDRYADKDILSKKKAARLKSRLNTRVKALAV